jgi:hypothetical protein
MVEIPTHLTNDDLLEATKKLAADERTTIAALVAHLAEIDARRLAVAAGYSLFTYCREVLLLSEDATCTRTTAARMVRAFPAVLPMLADGRLNLTTLRLLAPHLTPASHAELLAEAAGQSKQRVEELVARRFPQAVTTSVRRLSRQPRPASAPAAPAEETAPDAAPETSPASPESPAAAPPLAAPKPLAGKRAVTPMAEDVYLIRLAASRAMVDRLRHAQDLLAHAVARGDVTEVFDRALMALVEKLEKERFARRPKAVAGADRGKRGHTRTISAEVRRAVSVRDAERCAYVSPFGRRCDATAYLQFHHLRPYAVGGEETIGNIELRCLAHNQYEADVYFAPIREAMSARDSIRPGTDAASAFDRGRTAPGPTAGGA